MSPWTKDGPTFDRADSEGCHKQRLGAKFAMSRSFTHQQAKYAEYVKCNVATAMKMIGSDRCLRRQ